MISLASILQQGWNCSSSEECMLSSEKAKSELVAQLVRLARKEHLSYDEFGYICHQARKKLKLKKPKRELR